MRERTAVCSNRECNGHTGGKGLLELVGLVHVCDSERVQVAAAADLELDVVLALHDLHGCVGSGESKESRVR